MQEESPLIELYISLSDEEQNTYVEQVLSQMNLDAVVAHTLQKVGITQPIMLTVLITDDGSIREMNKQYREQDKATDVLSFPLQEKPLVDAPADQLWSLPEDDSTKDEMQSIDETIETETLNTEFITPPGMPMNIGDIVISWPTILQQAKQAGHDYQTELLYLLAHGVLHLVGYDDQTEAGYRTMVTLQQQVLQEIGQEAYRHESIS